jgi:type IX secretion system PorP/SprF family membrane protein
MKKLLLLILIITCFRLFPKAQVDPHFSEYYIYPSWVNPALTGSFDGNVRVSAIYRSQWASIANGLQTIGVSADAVTNKDLNLGLGIFQQSAGTGYKYLNAAASLSYTGLKFGKDGENVIALGLQAGLINRRFDASKFQLGDQWNQVTGYVPDNVTGDQIGTKSSSVFDAGAGALWYNTGVTAKVHPYLGFSANHLTQPADNFTTGSVKGKLPVRYTVHGGVSIAVSQGFLINPNFLYLRQGTADEKMVGAYAQVKASDAVDVLGGVNVRFNDAVVPFAGMQFKNFLIGASYDVNTSQLGKSISNANSFELTLSYVFAKNKLLAPKYFSCPKL